MPSTSRLPSALTAVATTPPAYAGVPRRAHLGDAALLASALGERVEPEVAARTAVERALEDARDDAVELRADARHLAPGDALAAARTYEVVDAASGDAFDVGLLDHREAGAPALRRVTHWGLRSPEAAPACAATSASITASASRRKSRSAPAACLRSNSNKFTGRSPYGGQCCELKSALG